MSSKRIIQKAVFKVSDNNGKEYAFIYKVDDKELSKAFFIQEPLLWSINQPNLYRYTLELFYETDSEIFEGRFAFRTLSTNGKEICLNGVPLYVRGYIRGAEAHEHKNNARLSEEDFYRKNIIKAKKFGFNFVRFHSVVPSDAFFRVADELGLLVHIELREPHSIYDNLQEMVDTGRAVISQEFLEDVVNRLYHHPSLAVYCIGNEIKNIESGKIGEIFERIRCLDDTRLFLDTCAWGSNGRPYVDIDVQHLSYYFPFGKHANMYEDTDNLLVVDSLFEKPLKSIGERASVFRSLSFSVPLIAHETAHYVALRDFKTLKKKFEGYNMPCPWWIGEGLKMIQAKGLKNEYEEMYQASKYFQKECWKTAYEAMRTSKLLGGFHFLQFADTDKYENSNGIVDCFDDENLVQSFDFLKFNGDRVLVAKLGNRIFYGEENISIPVYLSNYGEDRESLADFSMTLIDKNGKEYASCALKNIDVIKKGLYCICKVGVILPRVKDSEKVIIKMKLAIGEDVYAENDWNIWVYEKKESYSYAEFVSYNDEEIVVTSDVEKALSGLEKGKKVCLVYRSEWTRHVRNKTQAKPKYALKTTWNRFKPVIWDRGTNCGGLCDCERLKSFGFDTERYYDFNYSVLTEDCDKIILDDFPCAVHSIVSGIDKACRDRFDAGKNHFNLPEFMYDRMLRRFSYLFECKIGKGDLLVCGLNMTGLDEKEPSTVAMADGILRYMKSKAFAPCKGTDLETLRSYLKKCAENPVKERMMTQFWQLDDAPVESKEYWRESKAYLIE